MLPTGTIEVREQVLGVVRGAAELPCACEPNKPCLGCQARAALEFLTTSGFRMTRWRNSAGPNMCVVHAAGPVIDCREYRRSCPGYIVDRRQTCSDCGRELVHGRWSIFFAPGELVSVRYPRDGSGWAGRPYPADGSPGEIRCTEPAAADVYEVA